MSGLFVGVARSAVKTTAAALDTVRHPAPGIVILAYHRVGAGTGVEVDLPVGRFAEQMELLADETEVVTLGEALRRLRGSAPGHGRDAVVLTFDDGTADFVDHALPVLERLSLPVTVYVATDFVESRRAFPDEGTPLSWAALRDAVSSGLVEVGSHTHRHRLLDRVDLATAADEVERSQDLIRERIGVHARDFAYPKGVPPTGEVDALIRERFRSAALAGTRANGYGRTDPHRLARSPVQVSDGMRWFRRKLSGGLALEDTLRVLANRRRLAGAAT